MNSVDTPHLFWHEAPFCFIQSSEFTEGLFANQAFLKGEVVCDFQLSLPSWELSETSSDCFLVNGCYYKAHELSVVGFVSHSDTPSVYLRGTQLVALYDFPVNTEICLNFSSKTVIKN